MTKRLDALSAREDRDGKTWFLRIGSAFENRDGKGWTVILDAMPASVDGQYKIMLREPLPRDGERGGGSVRNNSRNQSQNRQAGGGRDDWGSDSLDDDIEF